MVHFDSPCDDYLALGAEALSALAGESGLFADLRNGLGGATGIWRL